MEKLKVASLFCGCGGTDVGILGDFEYLGNYYSSNNTEIVYANDIEPSACDIFEKNFGIKPDNRDIRKVKSGELPEFDILTGGFPCQSFSIVAQNPKRLGIKDEKGMLFFEMCRILRERKPKCFIAENVKGILTANKHEAFPLILKEFEESGYNVTYAVLNAASYGVPQKRERVIIVGFLKESDIKFEFPESIITNENDFVALGNCVEDNVPDKYFFSEKAVAGMMKNRESMNKGRAQDITKPCNTVGAHLAKVSLNKQVLCVTHLAQIACMADVHLQISKSDDDERTVTQVLMLMGVTGGLHREKWQGYSRFRKGLFLRVVSLHNIVRWAMQFPRLCSGT